LRVIAAQNAIIFLLFLPGDHGIVSFLPRETKGNGNKNEAERNKKIDENYHELLVDEH
jgi:hypothetical protein